ncbi:hypothetical protein E8F20_20600 [Pseudomonas sp. BN415]|uniref:hypothetical protein n=1 Tax=Pseudomonas sp. BN415 TaxID=2567889 RepID=UPI002456ADB7|nr:hypothetical protein [Pseudomonas sp. BN415]MDH4584266.1 hypothetical protein [Pseudomonas sp. BN415]
MQLHMGVRKEGDVLRLKALEGCSDAELGQILRTKGIEIVVGPMEDGRSRIGVRLPRGLSLKVERLRDCKSTAAYLAPDNH